MNTILRKVVFCLSFSVSAALYAQPKIERWARFEAEWTYASGGNLFREVQLSARFVGPDTTFTVAGFYDGNNRFKVRCMPTQTGTWTYTTSSNKKELNNKKGSFECVNATGNNRGPVKVSDVHHFKYADGTQYYPLGTTAYAWTHMGQGLQEQTLRSLQNSGFNKIRMCVFPKNYELVKEEPELYPFAVREVKIDEKGNVLNVWDFTQFNPAFFQHLEKRIDDLNRLGIEADLILFHPYDKGRWGFDAMPHEINVQYIKYLTARLASFRNVWWSMANEWDYVKSKTVADWDALTQAVVESDPYRHLCSIHGSTATYYDYWKPAFTHASIQDDAPLRHSGGVSTLRNVYHKPIILDEVGYEGNLKSRWGRYSAEEMTHLAWVGAMAGTYVTHGESYMFKDASDTIFWAKGGPFKGTSWKRFAFLRKILEEAPSPLSMSDVSRDYRTSSAGEGYYFVYFGSEVNDLWLFNLPAKNGEGPKLTAGKRFSIEIIDTWDMTVQAVPTVFETGPETDYRLFDKDLKKVRLPLRPYVALRIREVK